MAKKKQFILTIGVHTADGHHEDGIWNIAVDPESKKGRKFKAALDLLAESIGDPVLEYDNTRCVWKSVPA